MRSLKFKEPNSRSSSWDAAVYLTGYYLAGQLKADQVLQKLGEDFTGPRRAKAQSLFYGALRHGHCIDSILKKLCKKPPQTELRAIFLVTGYELLSAEESRVPQIIHHAVEQSKHLIAKAQSGFLNAVLRKIPAELSKLDSQESSVRHSHPKWLVDRWQKEFTAESTSELLKWNQETPKTYLKIYQESVLEEIRELVEPTQWQDFYTPAAGVDWMGEIKPLLDSGKVYIKDPSTRLAPALLSPSQGQCVLDLCAAPGGKAFDLAHSMEHSGTLVAVDLPGSRIQPLAENLNKLQSAALQTTVIEKDVLQLSAKDLLSENLPEEFDAVMLDAPCSNTGVIQRRTDVKWRLSAKDIEQCAALQKDLLKAASKLVRSGGRIVYSTCSIESAENIEVVDAFLSSAEGREFSLEKSEISHPWRTGHDGAGAFLLLRS